MGEYLLGRDFLQARRISKSFSGTVALDNVDFELKEGEVHALVGENGAGKSTLIKILSGIHKADQGDIYLDGNQVEIPDPLSAKRLGIAAIYQEPTVFSELSIAENVFMGHQACSRLTRRIDWGKMYAHTQRLLDSLGVKLDPQAKLKYLSAAEQQLIEIVKALSLNSKILIMDEPTSSLTLKEIERLFETMRRLKEQGTSIVFISHRLEEAFEIADRITVLRDGRYIGTKDIARDSVSVDEIIRMMVGRELTEMFPKQAAKIGSEILRVEHLTQQGHLYDISFELRKGEILGFSGLVGAGRTELAQAIFGLGKPDSGRIYVDGKEVRISNPWTALKYGIAYVPEDRQAQGLILPMNITHNITLPMIGRFSKMGWVDQYGETKNAKAYADILSIKARGLWEQVAKLSGGNQQKVVLAKWLATNPKILILDEPTRGIDVGVKVSVHEFVSELAAQGVGIVMISSELPEILGMSDRVMVMFEGRIAAEFSREEVTQDKVLSAAVGMTIEHKQRVG
ncbi:MAG: sugar ABC transporter ATP-binding protein [Firmicutes bacterium]|nr:sugar ABC transporter ATP-binding protein [Bacillota bacterium]